MTLFEVSTEEKLMRVCGENESTIRGERGDFDLNFENTQNLFNLPQALIHNIDHSRESLLFPNPYFKHYAGYNTYTETAIEYNLQPRDIRDFEYADVHRNYSYELYNKLNFSVNENLPIRLLDNNSIYILFRPYWRT